MDKRLIDSTWTYLGQLYKRYVSQCTGNEDSVALVLVRMCICLGMRPEAWGPRTRLLVACAISSPDTKRRPRESSNMSLPIHREDGWVEEQLFYPKCSFKIRKKSGAVLSKNESFHCSELRYISWTICWLHRCCAGLSIRHALPRSVLLRNHSSAPIVQWLSRLTK